MKVFCGILLTLLGINSLWAEGVAAPPPEVLKAFLMTRARARNVAEQWKQPTVGFEPDAAYGVGTGDEFYYEEKYFLFGGENRYRMEILPDARLIAFQDYLVDRPAHGLGQPTKATWDEKKAIEVATDYIRKMLGEMPKNLAPGEARYRSAKGMVNGVNGYSEGDWRVTFQRIDPVSGYSFSPLETIRVIIFESRGPCAIFVSTPARFDGVNFAPISKQDILEPAYEAALKMMDHGQLAEYFAGGHLLKDQAVGHLEVVKPNHFGGQDIYAGSHPDLNARLAWVMWYPWQPDGQTIDPKNPPRGLSAWIDAQDGALLGGDAFAK